MIKVLKQALEALEAQGLNVAGSGQLAVKAKYGLRQAIAELESQEPVAWMTINEYGEEDDIHYENPEGHLLEGWTYKPLYTTPQPVQEESLEPVEYWNAVEGWVKIDEVRKHFGSVGCSTIYKTAGEDRVPLYTHPPQRTEQEPVVCNCNQGQVCHICDPIIPLQRPKVVFPTMLRKMWSGGEVQAWLDENVNKEKNT